MEDRRFYTYVHLRASDNTPFYYGKGCDKRAWHFYEKGGRTSWWCKVALKNGVQVVITRTALTDTEAKAAEIEDIAKARSNGENIVNITAGGDSMDSQFASDIGKLGAVAAWGKIGHRERMRAVHLQLATTPERKAQLAIATKAANTLELCAARSILHKELATTPKRKMQLILARKAAHTVEAELKKAITMKIYGNTEEGKAALNTFQKLGSQIHFERLKTDPEYSANYKASLRAGWIKRKLNKGI